MHEVKRHKNPLEELRFHKLMTHELNYVKIGRKLRSSRKTMIFPNSQDFVAKLTRANDKMNEILNITKK